MNLVFYSGGDNTVNETIDLTLVDMVGDVNATIAYIPAKSDKDRKYFSRFQDYFSKYGFHNFRYFDVDEEFVLEELSQLFSSNVIYLSGGNTFRFLYNLKKRGLIEKLSEFASKKEAVLVGVSAGSMIMTPSIRSTVIYHKHKGDFNTLNDVQLTDFSGLSLVDFEFIPHYTQETKEFLITEFARNARNPVYGCSDGSGIVVRNNKISLYGNVVKLN